MTNTLTKVVPLHAGGTMIGAGGLFAPTIRHHNGTFFIVCTNVGAEGEDFEAENFLIRTSDIWSNVWSDPVKLDLHGIDPSLFVDDDGKAYLQGSFRLDRTEQPTSTIKQYEIDLATGARRSEIREIWPGHAQIYTEGPHIYKKDGFYYLLVAEGGTFEHHLLSIARSTDVWGPYESCPANPILTAYGTTEPVQDAGHGELFQDGEGLWWAAVLGVRKDGERYPMGRESFLCPVEWPRDKWPSISHPQGTFSRAGKTLKTASWWSLLGRSPRVDDCYIRKPVESDYSFSEKRIRLQASPNGLDAATGTATFLGKRQRNKRCIASATLSCSESDIAQPVSAGLVVYKDDVRYVSMLFELKSLSLQLVLRNNTPEDQVVKRTQLSERPAALQFQIVSSVLRYEFWWKVDGDREWTLLGEVDTAEMTCRDFTGTIFGVHARCSAEASGRPWVCFSDFAVRASS